MRGSKAAIAAAGLVLAGCVLQSDKPLIAEAQGALALEGLPVTFESWSLHGKNWEREDDRLTFTPVGRHYAASDGKSSITVTFKALPSGRWVMQAVEEGKPANYMRAERDGRDIYFSAIACKPLQEAGSFGKFVEFKGDDCIAKDGVDAAALFAAADRLPFEKVTKMTPAP